MLAALARNWGWIFFRAVLAASFAITAFAWPASAFVGFVYLFGFYTVIDGMAALVMAMDVRALRGFGSLLFEALVRIGAGLVAIGDPAMIVAFPRFLAGWAILTGVAEGVVAVALRQEMVGEWPLPFAGGLSILTALFLFATPDTVGVATLKWLVGPYLMIIAGTLFALARRMRQLDPEIEAS